MTPTSQNKNEIGEGPVGGGDYTVKDSDCVLKLAYEHGLKWETLWDHPDNAEVKRIRKHPELVMAGDRLTIPEIELGEVSRPAGQCHQFRRKDVPAKLKLRFVCEEPIEEEDATGGKAANPQDLHAASEDPDPIEPPPKAPRASVPYLLTIDGVLTEGETDADGAVAIAIPPNAKSGEITLEPGTEKETTYALCLGQLDPITELSGMQQRLSNLGFAAGTPGNEWTPQLEEAVRNLQEQHGLEVTSKFDAATRDKLEELHGA